MVKRTVILLLALMFVLSDVTFSSLADDTVLNVPVKCREGVTITPLSIRVSDGVASRNSPGNGKVYVIVAFRLTNNGPGSYYFLRDLNLTAKQDGKALDMIIPYNVIVEIIATSAAGRNYDPLPSGEMAPGETYEGEVGWIVDKDWKTLEITYSYEEFGAASAVFTFRNGSTSAKSAGLTTLYRSDFNRPNLDGWYGHICSLSLMDQGVLYVSGRTLDWNGPRRGFSLKPGVEYTVSVNVYYSRHVGPVTFMITLEQDGANWVNLVSGETTWGKWMTLEASFTPEPYGSYTLYVETLNAPDIDFFIRDFTIRGPKGAL